jgi:hypothetical protein
VPQSRYYGWYSNKSRGLRQRTAGAAAGKTSRSTGPAHAPPPAWRELIQQSGAPTRSNARSARACLRPIAVVETKAEILAILMPLGLARPHERPFALGPPRPEVAVLIDAATGDCHALDPPDFPPGLPYPHIRHEPIRFRAEVMEPGEDFDQNGFRTAPAAASRAGGSRAGRTVRRRLRPARFRRRRAGVLVRRKAGRPRETTTSFKPTPRNHFEASLLDSERPEVRLFAS